MRKRVMNGGDRVEYLKRVLGIEVLYGNEALEHLPNFISTRYDSQRVSLNGQKAVFLYPKTELEQVDTLKKHLERVKRTEIVRGFSTEKDHCTAERAFASRKNSIYCGWKANLFTLYGSVFAGTL